MSMKEQNVYYSTTDVVFLKKVFIDGHARIDVMDQDGNPLVYCRNYETAHVTVRQYGLIPVMVH